MGALMSTASAPPALDTLLVTNISLPDALLDRLRGLFKHVLYYPDAKEIDPSDLRRATVLFGFPPLLSSRAEVPNLSFVQLTSAGADRALESPIWKDRSNRPRLASASGVHTGAIPQYVIATTLALFHKLQEQILIAQNEHRWATREEIAGDGSPLFIRELRGRTFGVLGYGHIGRESARLATAFGARIIAATSDGLPKKQEGFIVPGTGDPEGSLPETYYSTSSPTSLHRFLSQSDVLLLAAPLTPSTRHIISRSTLFHLKPSSILINIGRGGLVDTDALVEALDEGRIAGAALDVSEPEPLPQGHPLWGRRNVVVTPHLSGVTERYFDLATDILEANVVRARRGAKLLNEVDPARGY